jgi:hypothetical protein
MKKKYKNKRAEQNSMLKFSLEGKPLGINHPVNFTTITPYL